MEYVSSFLWAQRATNADELTVFVPQVGPMIVNIDYKDMTLREVLLKIARKHRLRCVDNSNQSQSSFDSLPRLYTESYEFTISQDEKERLNVRKYLQPIAVLFICDNVVGDTCV